MGLLSDKVQRRKPGVAPLRMVLYGSPKVGKTRFACDAPSPLFLSTEDGVTRTDVDVIRPANMSDVTKLVAELTNDPHAYKTLVIDSFDWLEPIMYAELCKAKGWPSVAEAPYGKGFAPANEACRLFLGTLDELQHKRGMNIIIIAHPTLKKITNTGGADYGKIGLKLLEGSNCDVSRTLTEWATVIGYAKFDTTITKDENAKLAKVTSDGKALLCFGPAAEFECGSRYQLPSEIPFPDFKEFWRHYVGAMPVDENEAKTQLPALLGKLPKDEQEAVTRYLSDGDVDKIKKVYNRIKEKLNVQ